MDPQIRHRATLRQDDLAAASTHRITGASEGEELNLHGVDGIS